MNHEIHKQLKRLRDISPDPIFTARTRLAVLSQKQKLSYRDIFVSFMRQPVVIGSFACALLFFALFSVFSPTPTITSLKNAEALNNEVNALSINVHLKELSYQQNADSMIMAAITEIRDTKAGHLNSGTLNLESQGFNLQKNQTEDINKLLDTVIF